MSNQEQKRKRHYERKNPGKTWPGYRFSNKGRENISKGLLGKAKTPLSKEQKEKISKSLSGKPGPNLGKIMSREQKEKISRSMVGKPGPWLGKPLSEEHKESLSRSCSGIPKSEETRRRMSDSRKGKKLSDATKKKISVTKQNIPPEEWIGPAKKQLYCPDWRDPTINIRKRVRAFFGGKCVECRKTKEENGGYFLDVNHVNENKDACCTGEVGECLFVTLCKSHHAIATGPKNKEYYKQRYRELVALQYGGKCYYSLEEWEDLIKKGILKSEDWGKRDGH